MLRHAASGLEQQTVESPPPAALVERAERRTNLFVLAALRSPRESITVRIRDVSTHGMLVEGDHFPAVGSEVEVHRAALSAAGAVKWVRGNRAGLHLHAPTDVAQWLPHRARDGQSRVDEILHELRLGTAGSDDSIAKGAAATTPSDPAAIATELEALAQALSDDPLVVVRHAETLQQFDLLAYRLRRLG